MTSIIKENEIIVLTCNFLITKIYKVIFPTHYLYTLIIRKCIFLSYIHANIYLINMKFNFIKMFSLTYLQVH